MSNFKTMVRQKTAPHIPDAAVTLAVELLLDWRGGELQRWEVPDAVSLAGRIFASFAEALKAKAQAPSTFVPPSGRDLITADTICDQLEPRIGRLRKNLFRSDTPPFRAPADAYTWIKTASATRSSKTNAWNLRTVHQQLGELRRLTRADIALHHQVFRYPGPDGAVQTIGAPTGTRLYDLAREVDSIANLTNFWPAAVTWWVLLNIRPLLPRIRVAEHRGPMRRWVTLEINARDLTWNELWGTYRALRALPNTKRQKVNPLHYRIYELVRERGGVPKRGQVAFWTDIRNRLKKERRGNVPDTWNAIKKAYRSLHSGS